MGRSLIGERSPLVFGHLVIDVECHTARLASNLLQLTPKEFDLLCHFVLRPGRVWTRQQLVDAIWDYPDVDPRVVTIHVGNLRRKLAAAASGLGAAAPRIETVWDLGYRLEEPAGAPPASGRHQDGAASPHDTNRLPFIGREAELAALRRSLESAMLGEVRVALLAGEAGIGKTRLADEFAAQAEQVGARVYWGRCRDTSVIHPYGPWLEIVRQWEQGDAGKSPAAVFFRIPRATAVSPMGGQVARTRLLESLADAVSRQAQKGPLCLILEDLHWADSSTLLALQYLVRGLHQLPLLLLASYRPQEALEPPLLTEVIAETVRTDAAVILPLGPLSQAEVAGFLARCGYEENEDEFTLEVYRQCEGNPFLLTQLVRLLALRSPDGDAPAVPSGTVELGKAEGVRHVILRRLSRLSRQSRKTLEAASVIGTTFNAALLAEVLGLSRERTAARLEEAIDMHLLLAQEEVSGRYRFAHAAFRDVIYDELASAAREALHAKVARALERAHSAELDLHSFELARHYALGAGAGCGPQAVEYCIRAAESAASHCAWEEACSLWHEALELYDTLPADAPQRAWHVIAGVYERLATTYGLMGDLQRALEAAQAATEHVPAEETVWLARLRRVQTLWLDAGGRRTQAETGLMEAEVLLGPPGGQREPQWWQEWIDVHLSHCLPPFYDADLDQLRATASAIAEPVETHGTPLQKAQARLVTWLIDIKENRLASTDRTIGLAQEVAAAFAAAGSPDLLFAAEGALAVTFLFCRERREEAWRHLVLHRELAREKHEFIHQVRALWLQALWHRFHGDDDAARACALETLALLDDRPIARWRGQARGDLSWVAC